MLKWLMLSIYVILIVYILWRSIACIKNMNRQADLRWIYIPCVVVFLLCSSTLLLGGLLPYGSVRISLHKFSNYWLGFFIYLALFVFLADILRLLLYLINHKKKIAVLGQPKGHALMAAAVAVCSIGLTAYGLIHANTIYTSHYEVTVDKEAGNLENLNVVLVADLHLGYSIGKSNMQSMVEKINAEKPDLVLIAGDIIDNEFDAIEEPDQVAAILRQIKATYGVYAVYGNHDVAETLIGGFSISSGKNAIRDPREKTFVQECGFQMLEDSSVLIDDSFYVVGRIDGEKPGNGRTDRKTTRELLTGLDDSKPILLLSHEPDELKENANAGVDLQFSGHTHAGQFFPITLIRSLVWENSWGYLKVGDMHSFVTSGVGIYGPDMRVMTDSEIMQIQVHFQ